MCNIPKVRNRDRRKVGVKVDVHVEVRRVNESVLVGRNEICKILQPEPTQDRQPQRSLVSCTARSMNVQGSEPLRERVLTDFI